MEAWLVNDKSKLPVDLAETFPHLSKAPIAEAIVQFQATPTVAWEQSLLEPAMLAAFSDFPHRQNFSHLNMVVQFPAQQSSVAERWSGMRLATENKSQIVVLSETGVGVHKLPPYERWSTLQEASIEAWGRYLSIAKPEKISKIAVRFINRADISLEGQPLLEDYFTAVGGFPRGTLVGGFLQQYTLIANGHPYDVRVTRTIVPTSDKTKVALIFDLDVATTSETSVDPEEIKGRLAFIRWFKNHVFFGGVTDRYVDLFR